MKKKTLLFLSIAICSIFNAQVQYKILDSEYDTPIPNAEIKSSEKEILTYSDSQGQFTLPNEIKFVIISSPDFEDKYVQLNPSEPAIYLDLTYRLSEVEAKAENSKAKNLIKEVIFRRKENNPENLNSFQFTGYSKYVMDTNTDSLKLNEKKLEEGKDSSEYEFKKIFEKSAMFLWEKVEDYKHDSKLGDKVEITAQRMSGFKNPVYEFLALQPNSLYLDNEEFNFFLVKYPNPVSNLGLQKFRYVINDTIVINGRPTISVFFKPKKVEDGDKSIMGYIGIDQESKSIVNFYAERTKDPFAFIDMDWKRRDGYFFPNTQYFYIQLNGAGGSENISITSADDQSPPIWLDFKATFKNFEIPKTFEKNEFKGYEYEISPDLKKDSPEILATTRDSLSYRQEETYVTMDSLFQAEHLERKLRIHHIVTRGTIPLGNKLEIDALSLIQFNQFEGWRFEANIGTNENLHKKLKAKGYAAYGTRDNGFKYGGTLSWLISPSAAGNMYVQYKSDVFPYGRYKPNYFYDRTMIRELVNNYFYKQFYHTDQFTFGFEKDYFKHLTADVYMELGNEYSPIPYSYNYEPVGEKYKMVNGHISMIWKPFSKYLKTPYGKVTIEDRPTYIGVHLMKSFGDWGSAFDYESIETLFTHQINYSFGNLVLFGKAGYLWGNAPLFHNFEGDGNAHPKKNNFFRDLSFAGFRLFETLDASRFYMNKYVSFQIYQEFPEFRIFKNNKVKSDIFYKGMWGTNNNAPHVLIPVEAPTQYYQEIGAEIKNLFLFFGFGGYYRIGNYNVGEFYDDFYFKFSFDFKLK